MPQQPTAGPPPQSLRRVATAVLERPTHPTSHQPVQAQAVVAYPYPNYNPSRDIYYNPPPAVGLQNHLSPIQQQREQLEQYNRSRVPAHNYVSVSNCSFLVVPCFCYFLHLNFYSGGPNDLPGG